MRFDTNANDAGDIPSPTQCDDIGSNTLPAGASAVIDINGTHNVEQASAAAVLGTNSGASVTADAGVTFAFPGGCAAPPP